MTLLNDPDPMFTSDPIPTAKPPRVLHEVPQRQPRPAAPEPRASAIEPVETVYAGCRFRSRLEARWAVFLDQLAIRWEYEPECYRVGPIGARRGYLPDFWLPDQGLWVEVKGNPATLDLDLMVAAAHPTHGLPRTYGSADDRYGLLDTRIVILGPVPGFGGTHAALSVVGGEIVARDEVAVACRHRGDAAHLLQRVGEVVECTPERVAKWAGTDSLLEPFGGGIRPCRHAADAYIAARSARFEYGECGAPAIPAQHRPGPASRPAVPYVRRPAGRVTAATARKRWPEVVERVAELDPARAAALRSAKLVSAARRVFVLEFPDPEQAEMAEWGTGSRSVPRFDSLADAANDVLGRTWRAEYRVARRAA